MKKILLTALNASFPHTSLAVRLLRAQVPEAEVYEGHINLPFDRVLRDVARRGADAIGFSCYLWNIGYAMRLCGALKRALPGVTLFAGGPEVSYDARETLEANPALDFVLTGEGEGAFPAFAKALESGAYASVPGLVWRGGENPPAPPVAPETWPDAYADGIDGLESRILYVETSRGCPYGCGYCLSGGDAVRALDADTAVRRLTRLAEGGAALIKLVDRTFNFDRARARAIWAALIEHARRTGVKPTYHFEIAANLIGEEDARLLAQAPKGLFQFEAGVQTTSASVLQTVGRRVPFERVAEGVRRLAEGGNAHMHVDLIAGLPGEDMESFSRSFDDAFALGAEHLQLGFLKLLKGSALRRRADELGLRFEPDPPYEILATPQMDFFALCRLKDAERALDWYFSGRYASAQRLLTAGRSPFAVLTELADALRRSGVFDAERGEKARAQALLRFGLAPDWALGALIRHDLLRAGLRRELPDELAFEETPEQRKLLRERFRAPRGQCVCVSPLDIDAFLESGALIRRETTYLYAPEPERIT